MKKAKIILTVTTDLTYDQRMQKTCTTLSNAGFDVLLIGRRKASSINLSDDLPYQTKRIKCWFEQGFLFYFEFNVRLLIYLLFSKLDVLVSVDLDTILVGAILKRLKSFKAVFDAHELFTEVPEVVRRPKVQRVWQWIERVSINQFDVFYTVSQSIAEWYQTKYDLPFKVIFNYPAYSEAWSTPPEKPVLLYQGAVNEGRGLPEIITAMQGVQAQLLIAGDGDILMQMKELVQELKLTDQVEFLGYVLPHDLKAITQRVTVGLNLLEPKGLSYYYSLANKFFDYVQLGVPSLNSNFPEYQNCNRLHEVSILIDDLQPETIQKAIHDLITKEEVYLQLRNSCLEAKKQWNWEAQESLLIELVSP